MKKDTPIELHPTVQKDDLDEWLTRCYKKNLEENNRECAIISLWVKTPKSRRTDGLRRIKQWAFFSAPVWEAVNTIDIEIDEHLRNNPGKPIYIMNHSLTSPR